MIALRHILSKSKQVKPIRSISLSSKNHTKNDDKQSKSDDPTLTKTETEENIEIPSPPNNCCMSGCANCVWIQYADELHEKLQHGTKFAREVISREVEDVNMRAYLDMELRVLEDSKKKDDDDTKK